jgi:hypothetical protein
VNTKHDFGRTGSNPNSNARGGWLQDTPMPTAEEYRQFAAECFRWADEAETEEMREACLQMARDWTAAALRAEGLSRPEIPHASSSAA